MRIRVDPDQFRAQCQRFALRFCCEDCAHFHEHTDRCAHGWPTDDHRRQRHDRQDCCELIFCKEFELR